jgi:phosphatidylinositol dimannoside acyltransferase
MLTLRRLLRDALELFLIPGIALALSWPVCFRLFRRLSATSWLYRNETERALEGASKLVSIANPAAWASAYRLVRLVDHADLYLSRFRGDQWLRRYVSVQGPGWPKSGPVLAITFHWGAGLWGLRHFRARRRQVSVLVRRVDEGEFSDVSVHYWYERLRTHETARAGGAPVIYADARSIPAMKRAIAGGIPVVGLFDVSVAGQRNFVETRFLGRTAMFPRGLLFLAVSTRVPIIIYRVGLDRTSGYRTLVISAPLIAQSEQQLAEVLVQQLEEAIRADSAAWHNWPGVDGFFKPDVHVTTL